jgi:dolichol kinase
MRQNFINEIYRKLIHCSSFLLPAGYLHIVKDQNQMILLLSLLFLFSILVELLRNKIDLLQLLFNSNLRKILREKEVQGQFTGASWLLFGSLITVFIFPIEIAVPALIYLTIGDSFAAIIGKFYPVGKVGSKSISGTFSGIVSSSIIALQMNEVIPMQIIIFGSIIAMVVELIPHKKLNDNFTIPIVSALSIKLSLIFT